MINGVGAASFMPQRPLQGAAISQDQSTKLEALLSDYDAENLSEDDAKQIVSDIKDLGIAPGSELASAMAGSGFDASAVADKAGLGPSEGGQASAASRGRRWWRSEPRRGSGE